MKKSDKGKKVFGAIVILAIIVSVFSGVVSAVDLSGEVTQSVTDAEIQTEVCNADPSLPLGPLLASAKLGNTTRCYQCGDRTDDCFCNRENPCICCDNNCDGDCLDGCDGNCCWWAWDRACCLWDVGLKWCTNGGTWADKARSYEYRVSDTPEVGTIADGRSIQHVAWVVSVSEDKARVTVSEMNCWGICGKCSNPADPSNSVRTWEYSASVFEYIYPLTITAQSIYSSPASPGDELTFVYKIKNPSDRAVSNIRLGARIRTNSPQGSWIDDPSNDKVISVDPGEKDYSRKFRIPSDVSSSGYYDAGWIIVNQNTDEYQVAEAWVDENVMTRILYIEECSTPHAPTLTSPGTSSKPGEEIDTLTPTFRWQAVSGADQYGLYISKDPYGSSNIVYANEAISGSLTSLPLPSGYLQDGVKYRWNMRAHNSAGWSPYGIENGKTRLFFWVNIVPPNRVKGIDVSEYQGNINWPTVYDSGYRFAFARASLGDENPPTLIDDYFETNMENGRAAGMLMGAYHFAYPNYGTVASSEARHFLNVAGEYLKEGYLRPVLDLERGEELGKEALSNWVHEWMNTVKSETGIEPIIYVNSNYANNYLDSSVTQYDLWIAHWTYDPYTSPNTGIWASWDFWQYSDKGSVSGISGDVDLDIFNGDMGRLYTFVIEECCGNMNVNPTIWSPTIEHGHSDSQIVTVSASGGTVEGVRVSKISGPTWLSVSPTNLGDIASGSSKTFTMTASPPTGTSGDFAYTVRVSNTCGSPSSRDVTGTIHVECCGKMGVNPTSWSPPTINCGESNSQIVTVSATGGTVEGVTVSKISGETWLTLSQTNLGDIASGSSKTFTMTASPPAGTSRNDYPYTVRVSNTCGTPSTRDVTGTIHVVCCGNMAVDPTSWSPPTINCGESNSQIVTVSATGGTVEGVTVSKISGETWLTLSQTNLGDIPSGSSETFTVTAAPPAGTSSGDYPYTIRVSNTCGTPSSRDVSGTIHVECPDTTPPSAVTDLATTDPTSNSIKLTWTAPGDDGNTGTATTYDIRYLEGTPITESDWASSAIQCTDEPSPNPAGSAEAFVVTGLSPATKYYFALKTADEVPNWSPISNSPYGITKGAAIAATREISPQQVMNGSTFTVTVTIIANQDIYAPILDEDPPTGWSVTPVQNDGATFKESEIKWLWTESLSKGDSRTVIYDVTVPSDTTPEDYMLTGNVSAYGVEPITVGGDNTITVITDWNPWDDDGIITDSEIQEAVYCWLTDTPKNDHLIMDSEIQELVYMWLTG